MKLVAQVSFVLILHIGDNTQVPQRAGYIHVIMLELSQIASYLFWVGPFPVHVCARTPFFIYYEKERRYSVSVAWSNTVTAFFTYQ
jgi:NADH:ubiquinone oxidoreductase subunit D